MKRHLNSKRNVSLWAWLKTNPGEHSIISLFGAQSRTSFGKNLVLQTKNLKISYRRYTVTSWWMELVAQKSAGDMGQIHWVPTIEAAEGKNDSHSVVSNSFWSHRLYPPRIFYPWNSPGTNTGVGCHALLQGIFPIQGSNSGLLPCRQILSHLSHKDVFILRFCKWKGAHIFGQKMGKRLRPPSSKGSTERNIVENDMFVVNIT